MSKYLGNKYIYISCQFQRCYSPCILRSSRQTSQHLPSCPRPVLSASPCQWCRRSCQSDGYSRHSSKRSCLLSPSHELWCHGWRRLHHGWVPCCWLGKRRHLQLQASWSIGAAWTMYGYRVYVSIGTRYIVIFTYTYTYIHIYMCRYKSSNSEEPCLWWAPIEDLSRVPESSAEVYHSHHHSSMKRAYILCVGSIHLPM